MNEPTFGLDQLTLEELRAKAIELSGVRGGAAEFARFFGPTDFLALLDLMDDQGAGMQALGEALSELAHATLLVRTEPGKEGQIYVGTADPPRGVSDKSMVYIREALRPANKKVAENKETGMYAWPTDNIPNRGK